MNDDLLPQLNKSIQGLVRVSEAGKILVDDNCPALPKFFLTIEPILALGLKGGFWGPGTFWGFASKLARCLPEGDKVIAGVTALARVRTDTGKGRAFICLALNKHGLAEYLSALLWNADLLRSAYDERSIMRHGEQQQLFCELLEMLTPLNFNLRLNDSDYDIASKWQTDAARIEAESAVNPDARQATAVKGEAEGIAAEKAEAERIAAEKAEGRS
eukprot:TRINITY_DN2430_c0_g1_i3.p1 TRINITY_DN2430_c0_g1~~TRINITY_DN2430_c0_g1_i3.p1  ORF type:complete len:216 (+),score=29.28 TRINITY_DN2430_c0_g1_i3:138-785(+)